MPVPRCSQGAARLPGSGMAAAYCSPLVCHTAEVPLAPDTKGHQTRMQLKMPMYSPNEQKPDEFQQSSLKHIATSMGSAYSLNR